MQPFDSVICNGISVEPVYNKSKVSWKILTPVEYIKSIQTDDQPKFTTVFNTKPTIKGEVEDITSKMFKNYVEFQQFLKK